MPTKIVLGLQHGDEGKGRVVDDLVETWADVIVRFQGGGNAGHTVYDREGNKFVTHNLPVGVLNKHKINFIAKGCVVNIKDLAEEIDNFNVSKDQLKISSLCPIIEPTHILRDKLKYQGRLGTTARGIGPAYSDFYARDSILLRDLVSNSEECFNKIEKNFYDFQTQCSRNNVDGDFINNGFVFYNDWTSNFKSNVEKVVKYVINDENYIPKLYAENKNILLEGAQGSGLSINSNNYPDVTSSNPSVGSAMNATGLNHNQIDEVIGVIKSYKTKVGSGNFPSLITEGPERILAEVGQEFGATTGRPRKCGWLDLDEVISAVNLNGVDHICLIKTDVMTHIEEPYYYYQNKKNKTPRIKSVELNDTGFKNLLAIIRDTTEVKQISFTTGPKRGEIVWDNL